MGGERIPSTTGGLEAIPDEHLLSFLQLAHELRSPVNAIINCLDVVLQGYTAHDPKMQDDFLGRARDRAGNMLAQVDDFLRLGAIRSDELRRRTQCVSLLDVVNKIAPEMRLRARWRSVDLSLDLPESLGDVRGRYEDMEHLLSNLIDNAIKYTNPGGWVMVRLREHSDRVVGSVGDSGIGIPAQDLGKIFDEFYRAPNAKESGVQGTGLGLSIARRVLALHGGAITVESALGEGSTFTFTFPMASSDL